MLAARRTREPLAVLLPLIWLAVQTEQRNLVRSPLPLTEKIGKLPLYALDMHTRVGRRALDCFSRENTEIRELLRRYAPDRSGIDAVRVAAFYAEAACVASQFVTPTTRHLEALGIEADLLRAGVAPNGHQILINSVRLQLAHLNELRARFFHEAHTTA